MSMFKKEINLVLFAVLPFLCTACVKPKPYIASKAVVEKVRPDRIVLSASRGCYICHNIFAKRVPYRYYPIRISHKMHADLEIECVFCHRKAPASTSTEDYLMPAGHTFGNETSDTTLPDKNPCNTCHLYSSKFAKKDKKIPAKCGTCHESYATGKPLKYFSGTYSSNLKSNHKAHYKKGLPCLRCHVGFDLLEKPVYTYIPKMDLCNECHGNKSSPNTAAAEQENDLTAARRLFMENCVPCHGREGKGNGAVAAFFPPGLKPRDLTDSVHMAKRSDRQLFDVIYYGGPELTLSERMPAWGGLLSEEQVRRLVRYVRYLSNGKDKSG